MSATVRITVVFFKLIEGNFDHWALWLDGPSVSKLFQVAGDYGEMESQVLDEDPRDNSRLYQCITVGEINPDDQTAMEARIKTVPAQNDVALWDCQDYVLDILDALEDQGYVGGEEYTHLRRVLGSFRGPADEKRCLVEAYDPQDTNDDQTKRPTSQDNTDLDPSDDEWERKPVLSAEVVVDCDDEV